jgi:two-component system cell cycle response regulator DivK
MTGKQTRILLVDDYVDALEIWALYLRSRGYEVLTTGDGLKAVEMAEEHLPDLIILDLDLPGITGVEAARRLHGLAKTAHIPLVAATGYSHVKQLDEAHDAGFAAVLIKPCDPSALVKEIERVLGASHDIAAAGRAS